jgi:hypothetical protein
MGRQTIFKLPSDKSHENPFHFSRLVPRAQKMDRSVGVY